MIVFRKTRLNNLLLDFRIGYSDSNKSWILVNLTDQELDRVLLRVLFPNCYKGSTEWKNLPDNTKTMINLMEFLFLFIPEFVNNRTKNIPFYYRPLAKFLINHYYGWLKYHCNYDLKVSCETWDPNLFNPEIFPPEQNSQNFSKVLLVDPDSPYGKMGFKVLHILGINIDKFSVLDDTNISLDITLPLHNQIRDYYQDYQCVFIKPMNLFQEMNFALDISYDPTFLVYQVLAHFYASMNDYSAVMYPSSLEYHQVYRVPNGLFIPDNFIKSQFFYNLLNRFTPINTYNPIINFSDSAICNILADYVHTPQRKNFKPVFSQIQNIKNDRYPYPLYSSQFFNIWDRMTTKDLAFYYNYKISHDSQFDQVKRAVS